MTKASPSPIVGVKKANVPQAIGIIATAWGSLHGGINSISTSLTLALSRVLKSHDVVCCLPDSISGPPPDCEGLNIRFCYWNSSSGAPNTPEGIDAISEEILVKTKELGVLIWIGHDGHTGPLANILRDKTKTKSAVILHTSYADYAFVKHAVTDSAAVEAKNACQRKAIDQADFGFAVGPLLFRSLKEMLPDVRQDHEIIPGLPATLLSPKNSQRVIALCYGRLAADDNLIKQAPLVASAFGSAVAIGNKYGLRAMNGARLKLVGAPAAQAETLRAIANEKAGIMHLAYLGFCSIH